MMRWSWFGYDDSFMCACDMKGDDVMQSIGVDM